MASAATTSAQPPILEKYALPELPSVAAADPHRNVLDAARLSVAKIVSEAWGVDADKVFMGVDTGELSFTHLETRC